MFIACSSDVIVSLGSSCRVHEHDGFQKRLVCYGFRGQSEEVSRVEIRYCPSGDSFGAQSEVCLFEVMDPAGFA